MKEYDEITAKHYAAYRPPLHMLILHKCLKHEKFKRGLDIGCGTGQSSIAVSAYCKKVVGMDISQEMLQETMPHQNIEYQQYDGRSLHFPPNHFQLITFAGSLFYSKSQELLDQVITVCSHSGIVLVYDFEIFLADLLGELNFDLPPEANKYNHAADFSGLKLPGLIEIMRRTELVDIKVNSSNLVHVILSLKNIYNSLVESDHIEDPYSYLKDRLDLLSNGGDHVIKARLYYVKYQCSKK